MSDASGAPRARESLSRPRLLSKLRKSLLCKLTLVCAPAGSGKTTALSELASDVGVTAVWYRLDHTDRDPTVFTNRLLAKLSGLFDPAVRSRQTSLQECEPQVAVNWLARALSEAADATESQLLLLLDDYHSVSSNADINEMVASMVALASSNVHLVVSSRSVPQLPLSRLRLSGELLELSQEDLALDADEIRSLMDGLGGSSLTEEELQLILTKTGGWVAGVCMLRQLLASKGKGKDEAMTFLKGFGGESWLVYDYFAEEVLQRQTPEVQHFLVVTSFLSQLQGPMVNALLNISDGQKILESLAANNVFVLPMDDTRDRCRYHPLFRSFLRARARRTLSQRALDDINNRAARIHASRQNWGRAIEHFCEASNYADASAIIEKVGEEYLDQGKLETVQHWLHLLPESVARERPWLLLISGRIAERRGHYQQSIAALTQAHTLFAGHEHGGGLARVAVERALICYRMGNYREGVDLLEGALDSAPDDRTRTDMLGTLCLLYRELGELKRSVACGEDAMRTLAGAGLPRTRPALESRTARILAPTYMLQGDLDRALLLVEKSKDICIRHSVGGMEMAWVQCTAGQIHTMRGEAERARQAFHDAEYHGAGYVEPQRHRLNRWLGNLQTDLGNYSEAERCYDRAGFLPAERGWLHIRMGDVRRAQSIAQDAFQRTKSSEPLQRASLVVVQGIAHGAEGERSRGLELLHEAESLLAKHGYAHHLASLRLHIARMLAEGNRMAGAALLREALATAEGHGFYHFYWWEPRMLADLLPLILDDTHARRYVRRLVQQHTASVDREAMEPLLAPLHGDVDARGEPYPHEPQPNRTQFLVLCGDATTRARISQAMAGDPMISSCIQRLYQDFGLTWRELEVFLAYYLGCRFSETETQAPLRRHLAEELCMTENTLKSHIKSIRRKLQLPVGADGLYVYRVVVGSGMEVNR